MAINSLSASSYGLSGLVSGMNTQDMVEKMLLGTQTKIDKALQRKTTLQNKQTMYREVANKLATLQNSFLSFSGSTNLLSNSFYNTMTTKLMTSNSTSAAFSVSASTSARPGTVTMDYVNQLAKARTYKTNTAASGSVLGKLDQASASELYDNYSGADAKLVIQVGSKSITIDDAPEVFGGMTQSEVAAYLQNLFDTPAGTIDAQARFVDNKLQITATDPNDEIVIKSDNGSEIATKMFGVIDVAGKGVVSAAIDTDAYMPSFTIDLDGRSQTIHLDVGLLKAYKTSGSPTDAQALVTNINDQLVRYFGTGVKATPNSGSIEFTSGAASQKFTVTGEYDVMAVLGLKSGISNKLTTGLSLNDLNFGQTLSGDKQTFKINGVEFSFSSNATLDSVLNAINNSKAGVRITYQESEDRFVIQSTETGAYTSATDFFDNISQTEGNLMSVMFGKQGGNVTQAQGINVEMRGSTMLTDASVADGGVFTFNVDGRDVTFTVNRGLNDPAYTLETFTEKLNGMFRTRFGTMADGRQAIELTNDSGYMVINANDRNMVVKTVAHDADTNTHLLGFTAGQSTLAANGSVTLAEAGISFGTGAEIKIMVGGTPPAVTITTAELNTCVTLDDLAALIQTKTSGAATVKFDSNTGAFVIKGDGSTSVEISIVEGTGSTNLGNIFGKMSISVNQAADTTFADMTEAGQNAIFSIDGYEYERASNTFTIDGLTYTLHDVTQGMKLKDGAPANPDPILDYEWYDNGPTKIAVARDTDQIVEGITEFFKLYNETIDYITELYKADATYKDYAPLTKEQKASMSDREIELWEEKSMEGLLRNDSILDTILTSMTNALYTKPEGSGIAIYDLGISTSFYGKDYNFNIESVDDLRMYIEANPEAIQQLFAGDAGIMVLLGEAINNVNSVSRNSRTGEYYVGYLVNMAGSSALDSDSSIYKQIKEIDNQLTTLEERYWSEYNRYWKQFNAMETLIQQMNAQSQWLYSQFE